MIVRDLGRLHFLGRSANFTCPAQGSLSSQPTTQIYVSHPHVITAELPRRTPTQVDLMRLACAAQADRRCRVSRLVEEVLVMVS
jgi:hypothetical protein